MEVRGKDPPLPSLNLSKSPSLGLLTHTLVRSPVVKWIIPARIRHQDKNDVLFISADSVIIKKARGDSTLKEVAVKTDFDSTIRSARILGDKRQLTKNKSKYLYAIDGDHWQDEPETAVTTDGDNYFTDEEDIADDEALHRRELPPHILVLALDSNKIVFMCAVSGPSENVQLVCGIKELPAAISPLEQLGEHIAVDPK